MAQFEEYSAAFQVTCDPGILDFCLRDSEYCIYRGPAPLLTPGRNIFSHPSEAVIRLILTDLQLHARTRTPALSSPILYSFRTDVIQAGTDPFLADWENLLRSDPFVQIKTSGNPSLHPLDPDDPMLAFAFNSLTALSVAVSNFAGKVMSEIHLDEVDAHPFVSLLRLSYERLPDDQKAGVQALSRVHHAGIVLPLILVMDELSLAEYAKGLIALNMMPVEEYIRILADTAMVMAYLDLVMKKPGQEKQVDALIREGEGGSVEFKSTLRWDLRQGKTNPAIERACLKTISAFLNSAGGSLLIGVRDDGSIEGIESDKFANEDKFLLHLWTLIRTCLGMDFTPYIRTRLVKKGDKTICITDCQPSGRPVFLRQPGFDEEMYIRVGPSSNALDISEALDYIRDHFVGGH